ncbi:MAG: hypothetical protein ABI895_16585 [Deltaproteobacteria bacterium]
MIERRWWGPIRGVGLVWALVSGVACSSSDDVNVDFSIGPPDDYQLGGQTGSLVPGCGVAPLSAAGSSVPAGDALAVLYAGDCLEQALAAQLALAGMGANGVVLELVPLEGNGVFLVRADQSLASGDYQLALGTGPQSEVRVGDEALAVPLRLGPLELVPTQGVCVDRLRFELTLDDAALAYAPLSRFDVSIDRGAEQLWVDYGALPIEVSAEGSRGLLELPRCGSRGCLAGGTHRLELRTRVAGEDLQPEPLELTFDVHCPVGASLEPGDDSPEPEAGCSLSRSAEPSTPMAILALSWFVLRRRARRAEPAFRRA